MGSLRKEAFEKQQAGFSKERQEAHERRTGHKAKALKKMAGTKKELEIAKKPPSFFKNYSGGKQGWLKEQNRAKDYKKGGKYY